MTIKQFFSIIKARWRLGLLLWILVATSCLGATLLLPRTYTAIAAVILDVKSPDPIAGMILPGMMQPGYMATQLDLIRSERVALGATEQVGLKSDDRLKRQWVAATNGQGSFDAWLADLTLKKLEARPSRESNVITISYRADEPKLAAQMANAFVDSYIRTVLELRVEPAREYSKLFESQTRQARNALQAAQLKLTAYQQSNGLVVTDERLDIENERLGELSSQLVSIQGIASESSARRTQSAASPESTSEVLSNPTISSLTADLARQEARLREMESKFGYAHPNVQELTANVRELKTKLDNEIRKINSSIGLNNQVNQSRESQLKKALQQQRDKVVSLRKTRDEAITLSKEVLETQKAYDSMLARRNQTLLESQSTLTNVSIVKRATEPFSPSSPNVSLNLMMAAAIGVILSIGCVLILETSNRILRTDDDITLQLEVPVLGKVPRVEFTGKSAGTKNEQGGSYQLSNDTDLPIGGPST